METNSKQLISLKSGTRQGCSLSPYQESVIQNLSYQVLFKITLEVLAEVIRHLKEIKEVQMGKEEAKVSLFTDDMIVYINDPKNSSREYLQLI